MKGIMELAEHVRVLRGKVKTYAYVEGLMASGAYWIGSAVGKVYASATSEVGSIGVLTTIYDDKEYFERLGIKKADVG